MAQATANDVRLRRAKAKVFKALGHPLRLAIIEAIGKGELCVCDIARAVGAERSNVSRHLSILTSAGVLASRKDGLMVFHRLVTPCLTGVFACVQRVLRSQARDARKMFNDL